MDERCEICGQETVTGAMGVCLNPMCPSNGEFGGLIRAARNWSEAKSEEQSRRDALLEHISDTLECILDEIRKRR